MYISIDNGMVSQLLRLQVLKRLAQKYGAEVYNENNVMMTATHSHSCPGGFFQYWLYNIPSTGFIPQTLEALVEGIVRSVGRAHDNQSRARIYYNQGDLLGASINRSPTAYVNNPQEERAQYEHDTDKVMSLLRIVDLNDQPLAMLSWFPVHGTSMNNSNRLISSDNKGYASLLFEQEYSPPGTFPGKGKFVAIFAQANEGDVSPNTLGPRCANSGLPCDDATSTCGSQGDQVNRWRRTEPHKQSKSERRMWFFGKIRPLATGKRQDGFSSRSGSTGPTTDQQPAQAQNPGTTTNNKSGNSVSISYTCLYNHTYLLRYLLGLTTKHIANSIVIKHNNRMRNALPLDLARICSSPPRSLLIVNILRRVNYSPTKVACSESLVQSVSSMST